MNRAAIFCTVLDIIFLAAGEKKTKPILHPSLLRQVPAEILHCYHCVQNLHGCFSLVNISHIPIKFCSLDQPHCIVVKRLETGGKLTEFSRNCAEKCVPGCEWGVTYIRCTSCCNTSLCNIDSQASRKSPATVACTSAASILAWVVGVRALTPLPG